MGTKNTSGKVRAFSIMTYCNKQQIHQVIAAHNSSIRAYAYIYHDKDETTPHYHVIIRTFDAWSIAQLEKWFKGFVDADGKGINSFVQKAGDLYALRAYLTHADQDSQEDGKHRYDDSEIFDGGLLDLFPKKDACDETYEIIEHMTNGAPTRWLVRRYGKQFIYHFSQFVAVKEAIEREDYYEIACQGKKAHTDVMPYGWHITPPNNFEDIEDLDDL